MMFYTNYVTTPSGKGCSLKEIKNEEFFVLLKFIQANDYSGFYTALDSLIKETIPDFDELNIIDKAYIYLSTCFYSVHNTIITETTVLGPIESSLVTLLEAIENAASRLPSAYQYELSPTISTELTLPSKLSFTHSEITIDYLTGLSKIKDITFSSAQDDPKIALKLEHVIKKQFSVKCNLFNDISVDLILPDIFYLITQVFAENLDDYYELRYYALEYLKWDYQTFMNFTPLETRIAFNFFKIDKEKQAQERQKALNS